MSTSRDFVALAVLTAAQIEDLAQGNLARATPITSDVGPTSGTTSLDLITAAAVTPATTNRVLKLTLSWRSMSATDATYVAALRIQEGATVLAEQNQAIQGTGTGHHGGNLVAWVVSPTAAAHTYKGTITRVGGAGTATVQAAATYPLTLVVEDVGTA